jgi:hypothetical protein
MYWRRTLAALLVALALAGCTHEISGQAEARSPPDALGDSSLEHGAGDGGGM